MMDGATYSQRYRSKKRLEEIMANWRAWKKLPRKKQTLGALALAVQAAHLDPEYVREKTSLQVDVDLEQLELADAGDE